MTFNWTCPHCSRAQTVIDARYVNTCQPLKIGETDVGTLVYAISAVACSNPDCKKATISISIGGDANGNSWRIAHGKKIFQQTIVPQGSSKPQPEFIPLALREDYYEACLIRDLSPKASATLTRRCLQGMIRDFAQIKKGRLIDEIVALREAVNEGTADRAISPETVDAIDHVRGIGNIGAHMEKDINLIVPVDPGEAQALIELIELLFEEWYGARETRKAKLARIENIAMGKKEIKQPQNGSEPASASNDLPDNQAH